MMDDDGYIESRDIHAFILNKSLTCLINQIVLWWVFGRSHMVH